MIPLIQLFHLPTVFYRRLNSIVGCAIVLWLLLLSHIVRADNPVVNRLAIKTDQQIAHLQMQIDVMNKHIKQLEKRLNACLPAKPGNTTVNYTKNNPAKNTAVKKLAVTPSAPLIVVQPKQKKTIFEEVGHIRKNWEKLHRGLSKAELRQLLGEPASKFKFNREILWYYKYKGLGVGSVMLDSDGKVSEWQTPPFGL